MHIGKQILSFVYDSSGRLAYTKTPGCAPEEIRYSPAGRVVARHTPAMASGQWIVYFYDRYGREVIQATASLTSGNLTTISSRLFKAEYTSSGSYGGYTIVGGFPTAITLQKVTYYDDYSFVEGSDSDLLVGPPPYNAKGLITGVRDYSVPLAGVLTSVNIYTPEGFVSAVNTRMLNGTQMRSFTYDRRGKVLTELEVFTPKTGKTYVRVTTNTYDKAERLVSSTVVENGKTARIERTYGKNGLLSREKFGNKLSRSYTYDIHGWLTSSTLTSLNSIVSTQSDSRTEEYYSPLAVGGSIVRPPSINVVNLTEQLLYAEGTNPLYSGCPSAKVMISGGRYDYTFDNHRRLTKAAYTPKTSGSSEDFSVEYAYDAVANPQYVKRKGIINVSATGKETFGILDELGYSYEGNQLTDITQLNQGVDFYGRTGYAPMSGTYTWNEAGLLNSDSSRGILSTSYNHLGLPKLQKVSVNSMIAQTVFYTYNCDGELLSVSGGTPRYYSGSRIFENNTLEYSYFPGGYFDAAGAAHYTHTDYQGSIIAVTDSTGKVIQKVDYYPYGEPWREPSGQPMLFSGKERTSLADYRFGPRSLSAATGLWSAPDILSCSYRNISPYSYCAGNPIYYIDPTGLKIAQNSEKVWAKLQSNIEKKKQKLEDEIAKSEASNWSAEKKAKKIGDKRERVASLDKTLANMDLLEASEQVYSLNRQYTSTGTISYNNETDIISIIYANAAGFVHEVTHAAQYEYGEIGFSIDGFTVGQDILDEIEAYSAQYAFKPSIVTSIKSSIGVKRISDITIEWLQNITVDGANPYGLGGDNHTGISPININSGYDEIIKAYPSLSGNIEKSSLLRDWMFKYKK